MARRRTRDVDWNQPFWAEERRTLAPRIDELVGEAGGCNIPEERLRWYAFWLAFWERLVAEWAIIEWLDPPVKEDIGVRKFIAASEKFIEGLAALEEVLRPNPRDTLDLARALRSAPIL